MNKYKILVTGGTGFIGSHLVEKLVKDDHDVKCLIRKTSNSELLDRLGIEKIYGDINDISSIETALKEIDIVYHTVGVLGKWTVPEETYWRVHVHGTKNLLDSIIKNGKIKRLIYCSTAGVLGPITKLPADESYPYNPTNIYEITKVEAEKLVLDYYNKYGIAMTIIRPELVYGPRDLHTLKMFQTIKKGIFPIIGDGNSTLLPIYIDDLIRAFVSCIDDNIDNNISNKSIGEVYLVGGDKLTTIKELTTYIADAMGVQPPKIYVPVVVANALAIIAESFAKVFKFDPPMTKSRVRFFTESRGSAFEKANRDLGYSPNIGIEDGMRMTVEWYRQNNLL